MDKKERFNGVCDFLSIHWKAGTYDKFYDPSFVSKDKIASRTLQAKIKNELEDSESALNAVWHDSDLDIFIQALKRWAEANLSVIEFVEIHSIAVPGKERVSNEVKDILGE